MCLVILFARKGRLLWITKMHIFHQNQNSKLEIDFRIEFEENVAENSTMWQRERDMSCSYDLSVANGYSWRQDTKLDGHRSDITQLFLSAQEKSDTKAR